MDGIIVTLQEHLTDTCRTAEVAIDLEGRMGIEEVGVGTATGTPFGGIGNHVEHILDDCKRVVTVEHTGPEVDLPAKTPACSHVAALIQGVGSSREEIRV